MFLFTYMGFPQFGHLFALSLISFPHSGHLIKAMSNPSSFIFDCILSYLTIFVYNAVLNVWNTLFVMLIISSAYVAKKSQNISSCSKVISIPYENIALWHISCSKTLRKNRHAKYLIYKLFDYFYRTFRKYNFRHFFVTYCYTVILLLYSKQNHS